MGYLSYECNRFFEKTRPPKGRPEFPDVFYMITHKLLVFDHLMRKVKIVSNAHLGGATSPPARRRAYDRACRNIYDIHQRLLENLTVPGFSPAKRETRSDVKGDF